LPRRIFFLGAGRSIGYTQRMDELTRDHGPQPLDGLMDRWNLTNHELVEVSTEQLNHKQVQKARKGRQLTLTLMQKLMRTVNETIVAKLPKEQRPNFVPYLHKHLFNYAKGYDAAWVDPNEELMPK
jgi:Mor family transcriptional regulator